MILFVTLVTITMYTKQEVHSFAWILFQAIAELMRQVLYSDKFLVFNFTNFVNFQPFVKTFKQNFLAQRAACTSSKFAKLFQWNLLHSFAWILFQAIVELMRQVPYSAKFSQVFNFTNFVNFQLFVKIFKRNFLHEFFSSRCWVNKAIMLICKT